jgi:preprotein translocase subunit SecG
MDLLNLSIFLISIFLIVSIVIQSEEGKNTSLRFENSNLFSTKLEKFTWIALIIELFLIILQAKKQIV